MVELDEVAYFEGVQMLGLGRTLVHILDGEELAYHSFLCSPLKGERKAIS
jgi:hypothetical protein